MEGFFSTLTKQLLDGIRNATKEELRERVYGWFRDFNGGACRPEDAHLRAARPKPTRRPRGQVGAPDPNERDVIVYEDGSRQPPLPIVWDAAVNFPAKEAA